MLTKLTAILASLTLLIAPLAAARTSDDPSHPARQVRLGDISSVEGIRDNMLIGYGLVVGLKRTGDSQQTQFSTQTLANILTRMGLQIPVASVQIRNVAAVFVTATLPPFARPGARIDVTVSSIGDAKSIEGGILLLTPLHASDGQVYAAAQGPLAVAGYSVSSHGNTQQLNHPTVGRIPEGAIVERDASVDLSHLPHLALLLHDSSFSVARDAAASINKEFGKSIARSLDGTRIVIDSSGVAPDALPAMLARVGDVMVAVPPVAKVVVNERTGTVVLGRDVSLGACSVLQGSLAVDITTVYEVSQPNPLAPKGAETVVVPQTKVETKESPAQELRLHEGATVEDLVKGLQAIGATARDIVAILQAIKAAGALQAELEVI